MASTISVRLGKDVLKDLAKVEKKWQADRSEAIRRLLVQSIKEWKVKNVLEELKERKITISGAAKKAEVSLWGMIDLAKQEKIDWIEYDKEDLERDLKLSSG